MGSSVGLRKKNYSFKNEWWLCISLPLALTMRSTVGAEQRHKSGMERREERLRREVSFYRGLVKVVAVPFCDESCNRTGAFAHMTIEEGGKDKRKS